jgi:hypothetical protein
LEEAWQKEEQTDEWREGGGEEREGEKKKKRRKEAGTLYGYGFMPIGKQPAAGDARLRRRNVQGQVY